MPHIGNTGDAQFDTRRERLRGIRSGYEADGPDPAVPGASAGVERYAVVTESLRGYGYCVNYAATLADVDTVAAANVSDGWQPVCYYDLDELAGPEPPAQVGDVVQIDGSERRFGVSDVGCPHNGGELRYYDKDGTWARASECSIVERHPDNPDERNPKRYLVAKLVTVVAFNTEAAR
jgi:hypothetical protein